MKESPEDVYSKEVFLEGWGGLGPSREGRDSDLVVQGRDIGTTARGTYHREGHCTSYKREMSVTDQNPRASVRRASGDIGGVVSRDVGPWNDSRTKWGFLVFITQWKSSLTVAETSRPTLSVEIKVGVVRTVPR